MISFDNTEVAFGGKSDKDLQWSYRLFKLIGKPWLVKFGAAFTNFALAIRLPIKGIIKKTIFKQFCGGESISDCEQKTKSLAEFNIGTILDYSVEGKDSEHDLDKTREIPFTVFKPTGISRTALLEKWNSVDAKLSANEQAEMQVVLERLGAICKSAYENDVPVFIDAEDSWFQDGIDRMAKMMMEKYNKSKAIIYNTVQMYRHDRYQFLENTLADAKANNDIVGIKILRCAYMKKERARAKENGYPSPIHASKQETDLDYDKALRFLIEHLDTFAICAGTHNEKSSALLAELIEKKNLDKSNNKIYFAQLLGMSDHISFNLAHLGYNVGKYVPYGPVREVMPYLLRRAQENTSVAGQTGRELSLIIKEKNRRKKSKSA